MYEPDVNPELQRSVTFLRERLKRFCNSGAEFDRDVISKIESIVRLHRIQAKQSHGIDFPELVPLIFPSIRYVHLVRRDLEPKSIEATIVNLAQQFPMVPMAEMARSIGAAFPDFTKTHLNGLVGYSRRKLVS